MARAAELGRSGTGIVYVATRRRAEELAEAIDATGVRSAAYHAGLPRAQRDEVHDGFLDGTLAVVVATNAFGMGIDKPDVRFVLHADVPESVDAYYQEIGRAGRDGRPADAILYFRAEDMGLRRYLGAGGTVRGDDVAAVLAALDRAGGRLATDELQDAAEFGARKLTQVLNKLSDAGAVDVRGDEVVVTGDVDAGELIEAVEADEAARKDMDASRREMMRSYAEARACRRQMLLTYFGQSHEGSCGTCDTCLSGFVSGERPAASPFPPGTDVAHAAFGEGQVIRSDGDTLTVLFEGGYRNLSLAAVLERELLHAGVRPARHGRPRGRAAGVVRRTWGRRRPCRPGRSTRAGSCAGTAGGSPRRTRTSGSRRSRW